MAVYTVVSNTQIRHLTETYDLGVLLSVDAVAEGIENTNYFLSFAGTELPCSARRHYLLTIFEHLRHHELDFYLNWLEQLEHHQLPVAPAVRDKHNKRIQSVQDKPAVLFYKLNGQHPHSIDPEHCQAIGTALAQLHLVTLEIPEQHQGPRSMTWLKKLYSDIHLLLDGSDRQLLHAAMDYCQELFDIELPTGLIHGDLFPDNTLFEGHKLTGMVDFFSGGSGFLVFDLAVAVNAWCTSTDGKLCPKKSAALLQCYQARRPLSPVEQQHWHRLLVLTAMRFWLSRLADTLLTQPVPPPGAVIKLKDPREYRNILAQHLQQKTP